MLSTIGRGPCVRRVYSHQTERVRVNNPEPLTDSRKNLSDLSTLSSPQSCTLLARLPLEVRLQIWTIAVGNRTYHISLLPGRLASKICQNCREEDGRCHALWHLAHPYLDECHYESSSAVLLLQTCQQVYNETIDLLYSSNVLDISDLGVLKYFSQGAPPESLSLVRHLRVHWQDHSWNSRSLRLPTPHAGFDGTWEMFWRLALSELKGLRSIEIIMCSVEDENHMPEQASHSLSYQQELSEWEFRWGPHAKNRCRLVQGKRKSVES